MADTQEPPALTDAVQDLLQSWAREGFPNRWPLMDFCDEPTRFVPVRLTEPAPDSPPGSVGLLINAFPARARGAEYFQLRVSLQPSHDPEIPAWWAQWQVIDENQDSVRNLVIEYVAPETLSAITDFSARLLPLLRGACDMTNRPTIPTRRSLR